MQAARCPQSNDESDLLKRASDLPFDFQELRIVRETRPEGFRFSGHAVSIHAKLMGTEIVVCGEDNNGDIAEAKAYSELVERVTLICSSAKTSNGWAAHPSVHQARINAICELIERDAVLAQWYSREPFRILEFGALPLDIQGWVSRELSRSEFPELKVLLTTKGLGPSITCLLRNSQGYGVSAHATRTTFDESIRSALAEACRGAHSAIRREHWKESLKLKFGDPEVGPGAHALYRAYHEPFPSWMFGREINRWNAETSWNLRLPLMLKDQSPFKFLVVAKHPLFVGFAEHEKAIPLRWGATDVRTLSSSEGVRRLNLNQMNTEPHIVA